MKPKDKLRRHYYNLRFGRGDAFHCLFCGESYGRFLPSGVNRSILKKLNVTGAGRRLNAKCPHCFSNDRARLIYLFFKTQTELFDKPARLLHIAPDLHLAEVFYQSKTVDYFCGGLDGTIPNYLSPLLPLNVCDIPFAADYFDYVLCNHVLEYVQDDKKAFSEVLRILRPGGTAIMQVPIALKLSATDEAEAKLDRAETIRRFGHSDNLRMYGTDYPEKLKQAGFLVESHNAHDEQWVESIEKQGLDLREDLILAKKPLAACRILHHPNLSP
jgi:SAM-dependent methyltransferase